MSDTAIDYKRGLTFVCGEDEPLLTERLFGG
jgi:hypothetical protein